MAKAILAVILSAFLFQLTYAQSFQDSTQIPLLKQIYNAHCAFVLDGKWSTTRGSLPLGRQWREVADEFELSPEGYATFQQALRQKKRGNMFGLIGLGLAVGTAPLVGYASGTGLGLGAAVGSLTFSMISQNTHVNASNNFEKALWLRNRDAMAQQISIIVQPEFQQVYETQTLYLTNYGYVKNGKKYRVGPFGKRIAAEFENIASTQELYKQYRTHQWTGFLLYTAGLTSLLASLNLPGNNRRRPATGAIFFIGGLSASLAGAGLMSSGYKRLRQAVHFRNYEVIEQGMLRKQPF